MIDLPDNTRTAVFAGGCFWCTATDFESLAGVLAVVSGYTGGATANPSYHEVCSGQTGHAEAVQVFYDPDRVSYEALLERFWRIIDPTDPGGQFVDRGSPYRTAVFYADAEQKRLAEASLETLKRSGRFARAVVTEILPLGTFYPAEDHHQGFHRKNPGRYRTYRIHSGRDRFLETIWREET